MSKSPDYECKKCGGVEVSILPGSGPHAYKQVCAYCGTFQKWLSKQVVEGAQKHEAELEAEYNAREWEAIQAAKLGDSGGFYSAINKAKKIAEELNERLS